MYMCVYVHTVHTPMYMYVGLVLLCSLMFAALAVLSAICVSNHYSVNACMLM